MSETQSEKVSPHIPALDGVRGLAIALVLCFHSGLIVNGSGGLERVWLRVASVGWAGVDLFFVLSGFLITSILLQTRPRPRYFRTFFARRVLRIFPLYFVSLGLLFSYLACDERTWYWLFMQNWIPVLNGRAQPVSLEAYWSLAVEEQFYLVWPFLVFLLKPRQLPAFCLLTAGFACTARFVAKSAGVDYWTVMITTPFRLDSLAMGAFIASCRFSGQRRWLQRAAPLALSIAGLAAAIIALAERGYRPDGWWSQTAGYSIVAVLFASAIAIILDPGPIAKRFVRLLEIKLLMYLGHRSYAIYLFHMPVFVLMDVMYHRRLEAQDSTGTLDVQSAFLGFLACLVLAEISWHVLENPFLKMKRRFTCGDIQDARSAAGHSTQEDDAGPTAPVGPSEARPVHGHFS